MTEKRSLKKRLVTCLKINLWVIRWSIRNEIDFAVHKFKKGPWKRLGLFLGGVGGRITFIRMQRNLIIMRLKLTLWEIRRGIDMVIHEFKNGPWKRLCSFLDNVKARITVMRIRWYNSQKK